MLLLSGGSDGIRTKQWAMTCRISGHIKIVRGCKDSSEIFFQLDSQLLNGPLGAQTQRDPQHFPKCG